MDRRHLVGTRLLAFVATDAEPNVWVHQPFFRREAIIYESVPGVKAAIIHDVAAMADVAADTALQTNLGGVQKAIF